MGTRTVRGNASSPRATAGLDLNAFVTCVSSISHPCSHKNVFEIKAMACDRVHPMFPNGNKKLEKIENRCYVPEWEQTEGIHGKDLDMLPNGNMGQEIRTVEDLGRLIREERHRRGYTQDDLAALCGVGRRFLNELENAKGKRYDIRLVLHIVRRLGFRVLMKPHAGRYE